ncbi:opioid-binding protein/cell adhesion molecule homolog isoform X3 [Anguilla anguilla]|nr:opioid-binding protein/cell adhesion molecule homolog isoform X3 [Anguilla anguilla]
MMDNITVRQGETVVLRCLQGNSVTHTAWLNRSSILYAGEEKWSVDPRVSLLALNQEEFTIQIEDMDTSDEGLYTCAVQTRTRPRTTAVHIIVLVSPKIINLAKNITVNEGSNVTLLCSANGKPEPTVTWRFLSPADQVAVSEDEYLEIPAITRQKAGSYECTASNEVSTDVQTTELIVNYPPAVSEGKDIGVALGQRAILLCEADSQPAAEFEWYKEEKRITDEVEGIEIENTAEYSKLILFNISEDGYGNYTCVSINKLGSANTSIVVYEVIEPTSSTLLQEKTTFLMASTYYPILKEFGTFTLELTNHCDEKSEVSFHDIHPTIPHTILNYRMASSLNLLRNLLRRLLEEDHESPTLFGKGDLV